MHTDSAEEKFFTKPLLIIFVTIFIDLLGFGMVIPLLPFFAQDFLATPFEIGLLVSIYSWMQFFFAPILGGLSDRVGRRPVLFFSIIGSGVGYLMIGFAGSLAMIFAGRVLGGITVAFGFGFIMGPALAGILSKFGHEVPFFVAAGLSFANAAMLYFILPESIRPGAVVHARRGRIAELLDSVKDPRFASLVLQYFLLVMAFSMMNTAFPFFTNVSFGYDAEKTGYVLAYVGLLAVIMQGVLLDRFSKRFGEIRLVIAGTFILLLSFLAVPYVTKDSFGLVGLLIGAAGFAIGNGLSSPSLSSLASKNAHDHEQGKAMGVMQSAASLARAVSPTLTGILLNNSVDQVDQTTLTRNFWTAAAILAVTLVVAVMFYRRRDRVE